MFIPLGKLHLVGMPFLFFLPSWRRPFMCTFPASCVALMQNVNHHSHHIVACLRLCIVVFGHYTALYAVFYVQELTRFNVFMWICVDVQYFYDVYCPFYVHFYLFWYTSWVKAVGWTIPYLCVCVNCLSMCCYSKACTCKSKSTTCGFQLQLCAHGYNMLMC